MWSKAYIRMGEVDPVDVENFPPHLKRRLIANMTMILTSMAWMAGVAVLLKFK